jgi:molybdate transport repressor ModE-like protein
MSSDELKIGWFGVEWRHLAALQAVAQEGSFAGAARRLGYTQPAISQQIAALERRVGGSLIDRSNPGEARLTEAGELLVRHSAAIAARLQSAHDDVQAAFEGETAVVRLGVLPSVGARLLPPLLRRFTDEWVGVRVSLTESWSDKELLKRLRHGELDLAFAITPLEPGPFLARVVARDSHVLISSHDFGLARGGSPTSLADLANVPLLFLHQQAVIEALLRSHGVEPNIAFRSDDNQTLMALVAEGLGAAIVPRLTVNHDDPRLIEIPVHEALPVREIALAWSDEREISTPAQAFIDTALRPTHTKKGRS